MTAIGAGNIQIQSSPLELFGEPGGGQVSPAPLTREALQPLIREAVAYWRTAGISTDRLNVLGQVDLQIADLPGRQLGLAGAGTVWIDQDAAGHGWSLDGAAVAPVPGRVDLLSVLAHELGHVLGFDHDDAHHHNVMRETLDVGVRQVPEVGSGDSLPLLDVMLPAGWLAWVALDPLATAPRYREKGPQAPVSAVLPVAMGAAHGDLLDLAFSDSWSCSGNDSGFEDLILMDLLEV